MYDELIALREENAYLQKELRKLKDERNDEIILLTREVDQLKEELAESNNVYFELLHQYDTVANDWLDSLVEDYEYGR